MRRIADILVSTLSVRRTVCALLALCAVSLALQAQDYSRMAERTINGTARYVGMSGAMSAIGGDPTSVYDNPAGLGLYRRMEIMLTADAAFDRTRQYTPDGFINTTKRNRGMLAQASFVFSLPTYRADDDGVQYHNLMFSYQRLHSFHRAMVGSGLKDPSLGALLASSAVNWNIPFCSDRSTASEYLQLREAGYVNEYGVDYAMNIKNQWYVCLGIRMQSYMLSADANYVESFIATNEQGVAFANENRTTLLYSGTTAHLAAGLIYRPTQWLRLGMGLTTPTIGTLRIYSTGTFYAQTDSLRASYAPDGSSVDREFHMPLHLSSSVAFQFGAYGLLGLQYDYRHGNYIQDQHSMRVGLEVIPVMGLYLNAGYAFESTFSKDKIVPMDPSFDRQDTYFINPQWTQYASFGIGYRGEYMIFQAAYQYRWQRINLYAHENIAEPYNMHTDTHRIVFTIAWHQW